MRGIYTAGVMDFFIDQQLFFPYVVAVSAGACNGAAYLARQRGMGKILLTKYVRDRRYFHIGNLFRKKTLFGLDFIFDEIPNRLEPFAFERFRQSEEKLMVAATDCATGECVYYTKEDCDNIFLALRASCSLPFVSPRVQIGDRFLLDGGITSPVPLDKSITDGNERHIVVLTAPAAPGRFFPRLNWLYRCFYPRDQRLVQALGRHFHAYQEALVLLEKLQQEDQAFVIAPSKESCISSFERNHDRLERFYEQGYQDAQACHDRLTTWLTRNAKSETK